MRSVGLLRARLGANPPQPQRNWAVRGPRAGALGLGLGLRLRLGLGWASCDLGQRCGLATSAAPGSSSAGTGTSAGTIADTPAGSTGPEAGPEAGREAGAGAEADDDNRQSHFGFSDVDAGARQSMVDDVFHSVAQDYDVMNDLMSGALHRVWKNAFVEELLPLSCGQHAARVIDVAGGTGDIAFRIVEQSKAASPSAPPVHVTVCDINSSMLAVGAKRAQKRGLPQAQLDFVEGNAESLPQFADGSFDAYTISFGIRNVTDIPKALREAHRILRPGGRFMCLEFSHVANPVLKAAYDAHSFHVIPKLGEIFGDEKSYRYLVESIRKFPKQREFERMIREAGFSYVRHHNNTGGICAVHSGMKI